MSYTVAPAWTLPLADNPFTHVPTLRATFGNVRLKLDSEWLTETAADLIDDRAPSLTDKPAHWPFLEAVRELRHEQVRHSSNFRLHDPHRFELAFLPDPDDPNQYHVVAYYGHDAYEAALRRYARQHDWTDSHYDNRADRPSRVTKKDWDARRALWDRVIPTGVPGATCLTFVLPGGPAPSVIGFGKRERAALRRASHRIPDPPARLARLAARVYNDALDTSNRTLDDTIALLTASHDLTRAAVTRPDERTQQLLDRVRPITFDDLTSGADKRDPAHDLTAGELTDWVASLSTTT